MNLLSQWWTPDEEQRLSEIRECRDANESSGLFKDVSYLQSQGKSLTYRSLFGECVDRWPGELCVVANTDIIFDETIHLIEGHVDDETFVALTRWDSPVAPRMIGHVLHCPRTMEHKQKEHFDDFCFFSGSQDTWAFIATDKMRDAPDIPLGIQACDQAIAFWAASMGMRVLNPCLSVKTWHRHCTFVRPPSDGTMISGIYGYPQATTIEGTSEAMLASHEWTEKVRKFPPDWNVIRCQK